MYSAFQGSESCGFEGGEGAGGEPSGGHGLQAVPERAARAGPGPAAARKGVPRNENANNADALDRLLTVQLPGGAVLDVDETCMRRGRRDFGTMHVSWRLSLDGERHELELKHALFSGKRKVRLDGRVVMRKFKFFDTGSAHSFVLGREHTLKVLIRLVDGDLFGYQLLVDGVEVDPRGDPLMCWSDARRYDDRQRRRAKAAARSPAGRGEPCV